MTDEAENFSIQIVIHMLFRYESNPQANPNHGTIT
jgi:hypothetical protein